MANKPNAALAIAVIMALANLLLDTANAQGRIDWVETAYSDGAHNAFTDLACWKGAYYLGFRHAASHMSMDGEIRVMKSMDMKTWTPCATVDTFGDDRDAKLVATDDTLYLYFGTWDVVHKPGRAVPDRGSVRSYVAFTKDGATWSKAQGLYEPGFWLWRIRYHDGAFYSAAYTAVRPTPPARETRILRSADGLDWDLVSVLTKERMAGEADLLWRPDGEVWVLSRTGDTAGDAEWFTSDAAMKVWKSQATGTPIHSPVFATWKDRVFVAGRDYRRGNSATKIWEFTNGTCTEIVTLPSRGDTGYPGLLLDPTTLDTTSPAFLITWYSQHDAKNDEKDRADIYAARVTVERE